MFDSQFKKCGSIVLLSIYWRYSGKFTYGTSILWEVGEVIKKTPHSDFS